MVHCFKFGQCLCLRYFCPAMNNPKRYLVTAALPYANGPVHIGHLAGCYLPADIYVRYLRAQKKDVKFIGGSDEHGVPITIRAMKEGITPQQVVDRYHAIIKESMKQMGISFDIYSRTSNKVHHDTASAFFKKLYDDGLFEEKESEQYFDEKANTFLADRYITGTCPVCGNPNAYGDQCEKCGSSLSPEQLINPRSALSDAVPVKRKTKHWYFPLQNYEPWLKEWIIDGHKEWKNNVYGQCKSWLDSGLQSRAMTRDSNWGINVPLPGAEGKVLYVWFDAPIGYISATKELTDQWADYWCQADTQLVHFIGKDNIVFHCIISSMCRNRRAQRNAKAFRSDRRHRQSQSIPRGARSLGEEFPIRHTKENSMCRPIESMSDAALLSTLVGPRTAANLLKDASGSLSRLLNADVAQQVPSSSVGAKLMAARELVRRALAETMCERDMLASPAAVRDYLRIMLAQRDHEVFMVLFLDAQNRVIAPEEMFPCATRQ